MNYLWANTSEIKSHPYICGYCGHNPCSNEGYYAKAGPHTNQTGGLIYICHHCRRPTFVDYHDGRQHPGSPFGDSVQGIEQKVILDIYNEARRCMSASAHTSAVLCCRKLLMHIAVSKGAEEGKTFAFYVNYLADKKYVPPDAVEWVDHIREKGNEANHEIVIMSKDDAEEIISFSSMLLKMIYEFPAAVKRKSRVAA